MALWALASSATVNPVTVKAASTLDISLVTGATAAILLVGLLIAKELLRAYAAEPHVHGTLTQDAVHELASAANVAIVPLALVFALAVLQKILRVV